MEASSKGVSCPKCHDANVIPIVYGRPSGAAIKEAERGEIILRGCSPAPENYHCKQCKKDFRSSKQ
jgi:hypothetical protein